MAGALACLVCLVFMSGLTSGAEYLGGALMYKLYDNTNNVTMVNVTVTGGWTLGTGPCGVYCLVGQDTSALLQQIVHGRGQDYFGHWSTELSGRTHRIHRQDVTAVVTSQLHQHVRHLQRKERWEMEVGTFQIPLSGFLQYIDIKYFGNNMTRLTHQPGISHSYMQMKISMPGIRSDTGTYNRGPVTKSVPFMRLVIGRRYHLRVPIVDPDGDFLTCRPPRFVEFMELFKAPAPNVTINQDCSVDIYTDPSQYTIGDTGLVGIIVEDFPRHHIHIDNTLLYLDKYSVRSLSQSPVQFSFEITPGEDSPVFVYPPTPVKGQTYSLYLGTQLNIEVFAKPSVAHRTISSFRFVMDDISTRHNTFHMLDRPDIGPTVKSQEVTWIPRTEDKGYHILCVTAEDSEGFHSVSNYCFTIEVKDYMGADNLTPRPGMPYFMKFPQSGEIRFPVHSIGQFPIRAVSGTKGGVSIHMSSSSASNSTVSFIGPQDGSGTAILTVRTHSGISNKQHICFQVKDRLSSLSRCTTVQIMAADPCESRPCKNSGLCLSDQSASHWCQCSRGFTGAACEIAPDKCASQPCQNGGTCLMLFGNNYICTCPDEKTGKYCENDINYCRPDYCVYGVCEDEPEKASCRCAEGFIGEICSDCVKRCTWCSEPHGICIPGDDVRVYDTCTCSLRYSHPGSHCLHVNEDILMADKYGPKLIPPTPGQLSIIKCESGQYTQEKCSFPVYVASGTETSSAPVLKTIALASDNSFTVNLSHGSVSGISGVFMYVVNVKQSKDHQNQRHNYTVCLQLSTMRNTSDKGCFMVHFIPKGMHIYPGKQFRQFVEPTMPYDSGVSCNIGEACHVLLYTDKDGHHCERVFTSKDTAVEIFAPVLLDDKCMTDVAITQSVSSSYQRLCFRAGLGGESRCFGVTLNSNSDTCTASSCDQGGICVPRNNSHYCVCLAHYSGSRCQLYTGPCMHNVCMNGGICSLIDNTKHCLCPIGYTGDFCQNDDNLTDYAGKKEVVAVFYPGAIPKKITCFVKNECKINAFISSDGHSKFNVSLGYADRLFDGMHVYLEDNMTRGQTAEVRIAVLSLVPANVGHGQACIQIVDEMGGSVDEICYQITIRNGHQQRVNQVFPYFDSSSLPNNTVLECNVGESCHVMLWTHKADGEDECPLADKFGTGTDYAGVITIANRTRTCLLDVTLLTLSDNTTLEFCLALKSNNVHAIPYERGRFDTRCYMVVVTSNITVRSVCSDLYCFNGGYCDSRSDVPTCLCPLGYSDQQCERLQPGTRTFPVLIVNTKRVSFIDDALPSNMVCHINERCSFIINLWSPDTQVPAVWFDHVDDSIITENLAEYQLLHKSIPGMYSMSITINGTKAGTFDTILQTSDASGIVSDELWFKYEIRTGTTSIVSKSQVWIHFNNNARPTWTVYCPDAEFVNEPADSVHVFHGTNRTAEAGCMEDVTLLSSQNHLSTELFCFRLYLPTVPGETRCFTVQY